jgi:hypothetical protein
MPGLEGKTGMEAKCLGWKGRDRRGLDGSRMPVCEGRIGEDSLLSLVVRKLHNQGGKAFSASETRKWKLLE